MSGTPVVLTGEQMLREMHKRLASLERRPTAVPFWDPVHDGYVTAASSTSQTGPFTGDFTYTSCEIALAPGVWEISAAACVINATGLDYVSVGLWNQTLGALVADSIGVAGTSQVSGAATQAASLVSRTVMLRLADVTTIRARVLRNASSQAVTIAAASGPAVYLQAFRRA